MTSENASPARSERAPFYGQETRRALQNFPLSGRRMAAPFIHALGLTKACAARFAAELARRTGRPFRSAENQSVRADRKLRTRRPSSAASCV
jgi:hypothetical protein